MIDKLKTLLARLNPQYNDRIARQLMLSKLTLPKCTHELKYYDKYPVSVHPLIDEYLTFDERRQLLIKYGWIKPGQDAYCYRSNEIDRRIDIASHLRSSGIMILLNDDIKISRTGEKY